MSRRGESLKKECVDSSDASYMAQVVEECPTPLSVSSKVRSGAKNLNG